jgi:uncharacterized protein YqcC (DUF446 family)
MSMETLPLLPVDYLAIEIVFNLLSLCRRSKTITHNTLIRLIKKRKLQSVNEKLQALASRIPRLSFWIRLNQAASLISGGPSLFPTLVAEDWLTWNYAGQMRHLVEAWVNVPRNKNYQHIRAKIILDLVQERCLTKTQLQEITGLQALGICQGQQLTKVGKMLLTHSGENCFTPIPSQKWELRENNLIVPFPPDWELRWHLERFLEPVNGIYPLNKNSLRLAAQQSVKNQDPDLVSILGRGLNHKPPRKLIEDLQNQPIIQVIPGPVLEFTHPEELKRLRKSPGMRKKTNHLLSPRHVAIEPQQAGQVIQKLCNMGLITGNSWEENILSSNSTDCCPHDPVIARQYSKAERIYLLSLVLLVKEIRGASSLPPALIPTLAVGLNVSERQSAIRHAQKILGQLVPAPEWHPDDEDSAIVPKDLVLALQTAIDNENTIDILYQASGHHAPELRRISPLMIEERNGRYYVIAYCHLRRANRTFRLDRLELANTDQT